MEGAGVELSRRRPERLLHVLGLRRGGGEPPETRAGQPLRPITLPNIVTYLRVGMLGAFLAIALSSDDGRVTAGTICFALAAGGDYLDGLLARLTGQYSRLGTLMDPFIDRTVILSGAVVDWKFELLPRWVLATFAAREVLMLVLVAIGLRRGLDIEINWIGRIAVWPAMAGVGGALITDFWLAEALLYLGLAGAVAATAIYVRDGLGTLRAG